MKFWDSSALVPLLVEEATTGIGSSRSKPFSTPPGVCCALIPCERAIPSSSPPPSSHPRASPRRSSSSAWTTVS